MLQILGENKIYLGGDWKVTKRKGQVRREKGKDKGQLRV